MVTGNYRSSKEFFMIRLNSMLAIGAVSILALTGCNAEKAQTDAANSVVQNTTGVTSAAKDKVTGAVSGFTGLKGVVASTKAAVEAGDFAKAQTEIAKFEGFWATVEDGVKSKSSPAYDAIETNVSGVEEAVKSSDKPKAMDSLKGLDDAVATAAKL
jgi:tRNA A37 methylthiotransferase MiaB